MAHPVHPQIELCLHEPLKADKWLLLHHKQNKCLVVHLVLLELLFPLGGQTPTAAAGQTL